MRRFFFLSILMITSFLSPTVGSSQDWVSLKEASKNIRSVKAEFLQKRYLQILTKPLLSEGRFLFDASGSLRWEYLSPIRSVMLQRRNSIQLYHFSEGVWKPEITQSLESRRMVLMEISQWFRGRFDESKVFKNLYSPGPPARVILVPREGIDRFIRRIEIILSARPGVIERVEIEEPGDSRTSIEFRNVGINPSFAPEVFEKP